MRPRKLVLVVDSNQERLGLTRFVLEHRGHYRVLTQDAAGVVVTIRYEHDLVCVTNSRGDAWTLTEPQPVELLEVLRVAAIQKRGRKKRVREITA